MASDTKQIRVSPSTKDSLELIASIRSKGETPGQIASIATDLLLEAVKQSLGKKIDINDKIVLDYLSDELQATIMNV